MEMATVLIAEDNEGIRSTMAGALRDRGYAVLEAENGAEAVRLAEEHRPDLLLLDLMMPVLDGWSAAKELQENPATASIPRVAITALTLEPSSLDMLPAEFALVLPKPIALREMFGAIEGVLAGRRGHV